MSFVGPSASEYLRLFPGGSRLPNTSVLNFKPGDDLDNNAIALLAEGSLAVRLDSSASAHFILDVNGYFE